jgi:hypothetical protein
MTPPKAIIVDLDGTLALHVTPEGDLLRGHYEYEKVGDDLPNEPILNIVRELLYPDGPFGWSHYSLIAVSGREDSCRDQTDRWLCDQGVYPDALLMRTTGDRRDDSVVKQELYEAHIEGKFDVWFVLDDRDRVVKMWRDLGLTCLQVAPGDF